MRASKEMAASVAAQKAVEASPAAVDAGEGGETPVATQRAV